MTKEAMVMIKNYSTKSHRLRLPDAARKKVTIMKVALFYFVKKLFRAFMAKVGGNGSK